MLAVENVMDKSTKLKVLKLTFARELLKFVSSKVPPDMTQEDLIFFVAKDSNLSESEVAKAFALTSDLSLCTIAHITQALNLDLNLNPKARIRASKA